MVPIQARIDNSMWTFILIDCEERCMQRHNNNFIPNIFHIFFSPFCFSIIKTYDENSEITHYLPTKNVIHKIILLPNATNRICIVVL